MSRGRVWKYGDGVNTDVIFPGKYTYSPMEPEEMATHALEDLDPGFTAGVKQGDVIVAGRNFGCGSSREQAAICLKYAGVRAVIAESFARIFYRNAINQGLPAIQCQEAVKALEAGDELEIDFAKGLILSGRGEFPFPPFPESVLKILAAGGLIPSLL
ncbi:MAG: 3-isopropylmalate dehydratase small subunit [Acidobacteria bacterium]|nr:3-isopropylmalate dehydratase small subunit [Acidobacteriota bacterium]MBU4255330.1 3-isopropylmalate dehydratase small subunit [Acidobacteriota bacterium]MBU4494165.1 3-isopropylmalate dehydratase small subunit [Acidobacteriota bacterium]MCG2816948.1 3-isopropylmalate dehydratase small subunit [Candidatus Aminicenantes bacterium]